MNIEKEYIEFINGKHPNIAIWLSDCDGKEITLEFAEHLVKKLNLPVVSSLDCLNHKCGGNIGLTCRFGEKYKKCVSRQT